MKISLKESLTWPPFQKGFSMALWVRLSEGQSSRICPNLPRYNLETGKMICFQQYEINSLHAR